MPTFPAIIPSGRTFSPGEEPSTALVVLSGQEARVKHSNINKGTELAITFLLLTSTQLLEIRDHYYAQKSGFYTFPISPEVSTGEASVDDFTLPGYGWIYLGSPQVEDIPIPGDVPVNLHNVRVTLELVPLGASSGGPIPGGLITASVILTSEGVDRSVPGGFIPLGVNAYTIPDETLILVYASSMTAGPFSRIAVSVSVASGGVV